MPFFITSREDRRRQELKDLLDLEDGFESNPIKKLRGWINQNHKMILVSFLIALTAFTHIYIYGVLVQKRAQVRGYRAQVMSALQMRQNLVPALTVLIHHFVKHEENIFLSTAKAREESMDGRKLRDGLAKSLKAIESGNVSQGTLSRLLAVAENYPQLRSSEALQLVIGKLSEVENNVFIKRNEYNNMATDYNTFVAIFPINFVAALFQFKEEPFFVFGDKPEWVFKGGEDSSEFWLPMMSGTKEKVESVPESKPVSVPAVERRETIVKKMATES